MGHSVAIIGASGYVGGELLRLLAVHPSFHVVAVSGGRSAGATVADIHPHLSGATEVLRTVADLPKDDLDLVFSCLPSGELGPLLDGFSGSTTIVDLSDEHRAADGWVYGLTEFARGSLPATRIANPGCYPTATLLGILPFAAAGVVSGPVLVDGMSGVSGAGRKAEDRLLFAGLHGDLMAYGTTEHRHVPEMERCLAQVSGVQATVSFTPHLIPIARGLLATARVPLTTSPSDAEVLDLLKQRYNSEPFVEVVEEWPRVKAVAGSNRAHVHARVDRRSGYLVCSVAIDNLGKGAAGQAIQNANLCFGLPEEAGLQSFGVWP